MTHRFTKLIALTVVLASCATRPTLALESTEPQAVPATEAGAAVAPDSEAPDGEQAASPDAIVVELTDAINVYDAPDGAIIERQEPTSSFGATTTLPVIENGEDWLQVVLPGRPNSRTGWIMKDGLKLSSISYRVEISLSERKLRVYDGDTVLIDTTVAVGAEDNPTPTGTTFVTDLVRTSGDSLYGPFAYGLGFRSDQITEFAGGDGQIGIHGTNDPTSIGQAVSAGCVRAPNDVLATMVEILPLGTPVVIAA